MERGIGVVVLVFIVSSLFFGVSAQRVCRTFVTENELVVDQQLLNDIEEEETNLQRVVDCLTEGGILAFSESSLEVLTLEIESSLSIQGRSEEAVSITCVDGPIFRVNAADVQLSNLEIRDCRLDNEEDAPVVLLSGSSAEMTSVNFTNNTNMAGSSALRIGTDSELVVEGCHFNGNNGSWGTIHVTDGNTLTVSNSSFVDNTAYLGGGALRIESEQQRTTIVITNRSLFQNNEATVGEGGAILAIGNVRLTIGEDTIFRRNKAANQGGALFVRGSSSLRIEDAFFIENESDFLGGGAIHAENATNADLDVYISNTIFSKNAARNRLGSGGAIRLQGAAVTCTIDSGVSFTSNVAELDGGAVHVSEGSTVTIRATSFTGNEVHHGGGAALFALSSLYSGSRIRTMSLRIESSLFVQNRAVKGQRGGGTLGFASLGTEIEIEGCRFDGNEAELGSGGVLYLYDGPFATVKDSSFKDNKAIWGGVMFGEKQARYNISECIFHRNQAEEGGVAKIRGAIDVDIINSDIRNNSAVEDGGAIRAENHVYDGGDRARFRFENSTVVNNLAGYELRQEGFGSSVTRGGGIAVTGAGQYVEIVNSTFRNNSASEGGAIAAIGPAQFLMTGQSHFEDNLANFGGALFIFVNNDMDIWRDLYRISDATFVNNSARSEGGAVRLSSSTSANNLFPYNAASRTVRFQDCVIRRNRALNNGGGMMVTGVGLEFQNVEFIRNTAILDERVATSGQGGGIAAMDGASISISGGNIRDNVAHTSGGGLFVMDSSVAVFSSNFTRNRVRGESGNGGAVTLMLASSRMIPTLESGPYRRPILFRCNDCRFARNNAPVHGGGIYHHHSDSAANYSETWNCENLDVTTFDQFRTAQDFDLTCVWRVQTAEFLRNRHIRLARVQFIRNEAQSGAGIFTNHPDTIYVTDGNLEPIGVRFNQTVDNSTFLEAEGIIFRNNSVSKGGYGPNYASPPAIPLIPNVTNGSSIERRDGFRSGGSLEFSIEFCDAFRQKVSYIQNFTAEIQINKNNSDGDSAFLTGQLTDRLRENGTMVFSGTRLRGRQNANYSISIQFFLESEKITMNESARIDISIRPCRVGEKNVQGNNVSECVGCGEGQFNSNPTSGDCKGCDNIEGVQCLGDVAIPETHYWHPSSASSRAKRCIGHESCDFKNRTDLITRTERDAHLNGYNVSYRDEYNNSEIQCADGYRGILCGTCDEDYGREGDVCRKCAARGVRYFVIITLIFWSIVFVGAFIRSVLQLSKRIEFNKKFRGVSNPLTQTTPTEAIPGLSVIQGSTSDGEIQPDVEQLALQLQPYLEETNTYPVSKSFLRKMNAPKSPRSTSGSQSNQNAGQNQDTNLIQTVNSKKRRTRLAARLQQIKHNPSMKNMDPLTLANPVSEVLKVLINFLQVTSLAVSINVDWTRAMRRTLSGLGAASSLATGAGYSSLDCFMTSGSVPKSLRRMTIMLLYPFLLFLIFALFWALYTIRKRRSPDYLKRRIWLVVLSLNYFFYIGMTRNLLRFFACVKIDEEGVSDAESRLDGYYWEEDTSVECYSRRHALLVGLLVVPLLCAVTIGFPVGTLSILLANSHRLDDEEFVKTYGFLYRAYDIYYWEILVILRKGLIAAIAVFDYGLGENIQGLLCVMVLGVSLSLHLMFVPFTKEMPKLNRLETCSLSATIAVFLSGLIFNDSKTNNDTKVFLSVVAVLFVAGTLLLILFELFSSSEEAIDMLLLEHQIMDWDELLENRLSLKVERLILHFTTDAIVARRNRKRIKRGRHQQLAALPTTSASNPVSSGTNV